MSPAVTLAQISRRLAKRVNAIDTSSAAPYCYNPLDYARAPHEAYLERYGGGKKQCVLLGMNPGPFGMAQTGIPFGDVKLVRDFLGITAPVQKPKKEHPRRPIEGFDCRRSEVSGSRLWGWVRHRFEAPEPFFERFFVVNYCPLVFMGNTGANVTPDKLPRSLRESIEAACDQALIEIVDLLNPEWVIGIGAFAQKRAEKALQGPRIGTLLHPSPASPKANRGWAEEAERQLEALGIELP